MKFLAITLSASVALVNFLVVNAQSISAQVKTNQAHYTLAIHHGESATGPILAEVTLKCHSTGGSHPHAKQACHALDKVAGDFDQLMNNEGICNFIFDPVTATAKGSGYGKKVDFVKTYSNRCTLKRDTDGVFDF